MDPKYFNIWLNDQPLRMILLYPETTIGEIKSYTKKLISSITHPLDAYKIDVQYDSNNYFSVSFGPQSFDDIPLSSKWDDFTEPMIVITDPDYLSTMGDPFTLVTAQLNYHDMMSLCQTKTCTLVDWRSHLHHYFLVDNIPGDTPVKNIQNMARSLQVLEDADIPKFHRTYEYHKLTVDALKNVNNIGGLKDKYKYSSYIREYVLRSRSMREQMALKMALNDDDDADLTLEEELEMVSYVNIFILLDNLELYLYFLKPIHFQDIYLHRSNNIIKYLLDQNIPLHHREHPIDFYGLYFDTFNGYENFDKEIAKTLITKIPREDLIDHVRPNLIILNNMIDVSDLIEMI